MAFSYLNSENLFKAYRDSKSYMRVFFDPLDEYERLARNKPHPGIDKSYPKVTDGTTASIIQKTPRRIIQQLPTGKVTSDTNDWLSIVASFIYTNKIIPNANQQYSLLQKCWHMVKNSLTYGASHALTTFVARGLYYGTDLKVPYVKDVLFEPGKLSDLDSNFVFLRAWYQPRDIEAIIDREKTLQKSAKERGEKYESTWDLKALGDVKDETSQKTDDEMSRSEKEKQDQNKTGGVEIIHAFQRGIGATFYSFHPKTDRIVRRQTNPDPRGDIPISTMYADTDGHNPLGWGVVEQVGSLQNLMDSEMQMYQYNRALMLAPPIIKKGNYSKAQLKLVPNAIIDLGADPNNSAEPMAIDSTAITQFASNYGLMKSQLLNLTASPDTSISSEIGNPGFSKTPQGVNAQQEIVSIDDNYFRKQFETWFAQWSETAINLYFAERSGIEELQLDRATAMKLRKIDPGLVSEDDKVRIDYDTATEQLKFEVDASTSHMKDNQKQLEAMDGLLERYDKSPTLQTIVPPEKLVGVWNTIVSSSGAEDPEELTIDEEEFKQRMAQQQAQMQSQSPQMPPEEVGGQPIPDPAMEQQPMEQPPMQEAPMDLEGITEMEPVQLSEEDQAFLEELRAMGFEEDQVQQALAMDQAGLPNEEIIAVLEEANNG